MVAPDRPGLETAIGLPRFRHGASGSGDGFGRD